MKLKKLSERWSADTRLMTDTHSAQHAARPRDGQLAPGLETVVFCGFTNQEQTTIRHLVEQGL